MNNYVLSFEADIPGDVLSDKSYPIYDDESHMVGGFALKRGSLVVGFVSLPEWHKLYVATGISAYFTPDEGADGKVAGGRLTEVKVSALSVPINLRSLS